MSVAEMLSQKSKRVTPFLRFFLTRGFARASATGRDENRRVSALLAHILPSESNAARRGALCFASVADGSAASCDTEGKGPRSGKERQKKRAYSISVIRMVN